MYPNPRMTFFIQMDKIPESWEVGDVINLDPKGIEQVVILSIGKHDMEVRPYLPGITHKLESQKE